MSNFKAYGVYILVSLAVMAPLLLPGFILTLDLVFTPTLPMPREVTSSYLLHALLHVLNLVLPGEVIEKLLLLTILPLASIGMHRLIRAVQKREDIDWGIYVASIFFAINPFTYSRFMAGQYAVLLGYALLPWLVRLLISFAQRPTLAGALKLGALIALIGVVSIHTLAAVAILIAVAALIGMRQAKLIRYSLVAAGVTLLLSSYWLVPLALGQGKTAATINSFSAADSQAFATSGGNPLVRTANMLRLQGFWAEGKNLYLLPQERMMLWGLMALVIIGLVITGAVTLWKRSAPPARSNKQTALRVASGQPVALAESVLTERADGAGHQRLVLWLGVSALIALVLAAGALGPWAAGVPLLGGLREPHKLVALVALAYSVFLAIGVNALLARIREESDTWYGVSAVVVLAIPFLFMRVMFWGFDGQLTPRHYPADWSQAKELLQTQPSDRVLVLPWHQYMSFEFAGRTIASPAPAFFGSRAVVSQNPELGGASGGRYNETEQTVTSLLLNAKTGSSLTADLAKQNVAYVLLFKELDYSDYGYLDRQPALRLVGNYQTIKIYKNEAWSRP